MLVCMFSIALSNHVKHHAFIVCARLSHLGSHSVCILPRNVFTVHIFNNLRQVRQRISTLTEKEQRDVLNWVLGKHILVKRQQCVKKVLRLLLELFMQRLHNTAEFRLDFITH